MAYTDDIVQLVWEKGTCIEANDASIWRKDDCGAWIQRSMYGDRTSQYGWEIDSINPTGPEDISNLRPLQWRNSVARGTGRLICKVTASGVDNEDVVIVDQMQHRHTTG